MKILAKLFRSWLIGFFIYLTGVAVWGIDRPSSGVITHTEALVMGSVFLLLALGVATLWGKDK